MLDIDQIKKILPHRYPMIEKGPTDIFFPKTALGWITALS